MALAEARQQRQRARAAAERESIGQLIERCGWQQLQQGFTVAAQAVAAQINRRNAVARSG